MIKRLLWLNGLAVLGVAFHHASGYGFRAMFLWTDRYLPVSVPNYDLAGSLPFYLNVLIQQLDAFALPAFMFVSGVFVAFASGSAEQTIDWNVVGSRIKVLLIPFAVWTAIFFLLLRRQPPSTFDEVVSRYYYIVLLVQFYAVSPLLVLMISKSWKLVLGVLGTIELFISSLLYFQVLDVPIPRLETMIQITPKWLIPNLLFWFALGIVVGNHRETLPELLKRHRKRLALLFFALIPLMMVEYVVVQEYVAEPWLGPYFGGILRNLYAALFIFLFLAINQESIPFTKGLNVLGSRSLGVYLSHGPVMYVGAVIMYRLTPWILGHQLFYQGTLIFLGLGVPLVLMLLMRQSPARRYYRYVFG